MTTPAFDDIIDLFSCQHWSRKVWIYVVLPCAGWPPPHYVNGIDAQSIALISLNSDILIMNIIAPPFPSTVQKLSLYVRAI